MLEKLTAHRRALHQIPELEKAAAAHERIY